ncbi:DNA repair protein RAD10 KNAG_0G03610 [Huiozyma naganishii CBS 8797]|uniref:ERCC1-like central domain-containing protein n=1 Tax=Huiozyma naganishii (strain ATCC MYA-139 / BCRC 22969 / CBS 8797 / KCTC 17520 / NBRC 10181 / NCYC 3082 / Yp74L-3) TaxID=1071383 RepID=J7RP34_HUIN7|nr:hypothetical protein KNAG_0G03610 [Kazachstania naganishii CBS 8797]CCK71418.1 hypothetical protein KNAG_0G03610 [Kazachstania naganishii CBS 8797]
MNNTNPTSFKSILAGVKRLRNQAGEGDSDTSTNAVKSRQQKAPLSHGQDSSRLPSSTKVTNTFNQQRFVRDTDSRATGSTTQNKFQPTVAKGPSLGKTVLVNTTQKENPLLADLKNTAWRYISSTATRKIYYDYFIKNRSVLFLTLSYHKLYPDYLERRMLPLKVNENNILIFVKDDDSHSEETLTEITKIAMFNGFTLLLAFNFEQAAKYIEYLNTA